MSIEYAEHTACPVCQSLSISLKFPARRSLEEFVSTSGRKFSASAADFGIWYDLYECEHCSHVFAQRYPSNLGEFYHNADIATYDRRRLGRQKDFAFIVETIARLGLLGNKPNVLGIGCSTGALLAEFERYFNATTFGIEPSLQAAQVAIVNREGRVATGFFSQETLFDLQGFERADIVCATDVIEHVPDPSSFTRLIARSALRSNGLICFATPSVNSLSCRIMGPYWWSFRAMHLQYFSRKSLWTLLTQAGFKSVGIWPYVKHIELNRFVVPVSVGDVISVGVMT